MLLQYFLDLIHFLIRQLYFLSVFQNSLFGGCPRNGDDDRHSLSTTQRSDSSDRDLSNGHSLFVRQFLHFVRQFHVLGQDVVLKLWQVVPVISFRNVGTALNQPGQCSPHQWRIYHNWYSEFCTRWSDYIPQNISRPQAEFDFDRGYGVDFVSTSDGLSTYFTQTDTLDLALLYKLSESLDRLFNRRVGINPPTLENVKRLLPILNPNTLVNTSSHILRTAIHSQPSGYNTSLDV